MQSSSSDTNSLKFNIKQIVYSDHEALKISDGRILKQVSAHGVIWRTASKQRNYIPTHRFSGPISRSFNTHEHLSKIGYFMLKSLTFLDKLSAVLKREPSAQFLDKRVCKQGRLIC